MTGLFLAAACCVFTPRAAQAADAVPAPVSASARPVAGDLPPAYANIELVDVPTAHAQAHRSVALNVRMYEGSSVLSRLTIGLFDRLTIGIAWEVKDLIGSLPVKSGGPPQPYVKATLVREEARLPAIALGYYLQGYGPHGDPILSNGAFADKRPGDSYDLYFAKPRGFYLVATKETQQLAIVQWTAGFNIVRLPDYAFQHDFGAFAGLAAGLTQDLFFVAEYDDALNRSGGNFNLGINFHMGRGWRIEAGIKNLGKPKTGLLRRPATPGSNPALSRMIKLDILTGF